MTSVGEREGRNDLTSSMASFSSSVLKSKFLSEPAYSSHSLRANEKKMTGSHCLA